MTGAAKGCGRSTLAVATVVAAALMATSVATAAGRPRAPRQIRRQLSAIVAHARGYGIAGGVVGVAGGRIGSFARAFGSAAPGRAMARNDHFRTGSVTKTFTATVILELVDRNVLHLNDRIARWEPKLPNAKRITIRMLLDMRSGIWDEGGTGPKRAAVELEPMARRRSDGWSGT